VAVADLKLGALLWNQYTDWPSLLEAGRRADELGFDSLWTWDHVYPIVGSHEGPMFESWVTLSAWAMATERIRLGHMVIANTFREPALTAKMATALDHVSGGRFTLGLGAAWFRTEHEAFGFPYGEGPPERLRWLSEALPVIRGMLHGETPTAAGRRYHAREVRNDPPPVQRPLPLLVGGGGEKVTLRLVARYADANNLGGGFANVQRKEAILRQHCEKVGRDEREIERTTNIGALFIRDSEAEARRVQEWTFERNGGARPWATNQPVGTPEQIVEMLAPYLELGYRHIIAGLPAPYDDESMARFVGEVKPRLEQSAGVAIASA
jgi:alkanesulfonate monooxygenase SsuD/methylene tetrahydromethanopterin reductase-like flavin-dependent oxidoreductase (luciferase family)